MASQRASPAVRQLCSAFGPHRQRQCTLQSRAMATHVDSTTSPDATLSETYLETHLDSANTEPILKDVAAPPPPPKSPTASPQQAQPYTPPRNPFLTTATCTLHAFPSLEPTRFAQYPSTHLLLPIRKDILHRAVVYEGDKTRQGTASTKWRDDVHGSHKKIRPQKGTGRARLGDKQSPMLRGGGVAFGPKPRDFATGLQRQVYDLAWRTALSYRYKMGQLILLERTANLGDIGVHARQRYLTEMLGFNKMGNRDGRTLFVTLKEREVLFDTLRSGNMEREGRAKDVEDVDVKDLLSLGRVVMEKEALEWIFREHQSDLAPSQWLTNWERFMAAERLTSASQPSVRDLV